MKELRKARENFKKEAMPKPLKVGKGSSGEME